MTWNAACRSRIGGNHRVTGIACRRVFAFVLFLGIVSPSLAGMFDKAYFGAVWLAPLSAVKPVVRGKLLRYDKTLSPWDVPYVRELGHLYYLEDKVFSRLVASLPMHGGGTELTEYYFYENRLSMVKVSYRSERASFQGLLESISADYGKARKETSEGPEGMFVQHTFELPRLIVEVSYHPVKVKGGYRCKGLVLRIVHRSYIESVKAYHETLKAKYGKE